MNYSRKGEEGREQAARRREDGPIFMYAVGSVWVRGLVTGAKAAHRCNPPSPLIRPFLLQGSIYCTQLIAVN